jgi:hypothetical protein
MPFALPFADWIARARPLADRWRAILAALAGPGAAW